MERRSYQSLCHSFTKIWRYWSNSWFTHLVCLSDCGCHAIKKAIFTPRKWYSSLVKSITNYRPLSNTTWLERLWSFHIWCRNNPCCALHGDSNIGWNEVYSLGNRVYYHHDCIIPWWFWKFDHKIHTDSIPPYIWYSQQK